MAIKPAKMTSHHLLSHPKVAVLAEEVEAEHVISNVTAIVLQLMNQSNPEDQEALQALLSGFSPEHQGSQIYLVASGHTMAGMALESLSMTLRVRTYPDMALVASVSFAFVKASNGGWGELQVTNKQVRDEQLTASIDRIAAWGISDWVFASGMVGKMTIPSRRADAIRSWLAKMEDVLIGVLSVSGVTMVSSEAEAAVAAGGDKDPPTAWLVTPTLFQQLQKLGAKVTSWKGLPLWLAEPNTKPSATKEIQEVAFSRIDHSAGDALSTHQEKTP